MSQTEDAPPARTWWVFDLPLHRDPLVWVAIALWCVWVAFGRGDRSGMSPGANWFQAIIGLPSMLYGIGVVGGSVREFRRGLANGRRP